MSIYIFSILNVYIVFKQRYNSLIARIVYEFDKDYIEIKESQQQMRKVKKKEICI